MINITSRRKSILSDNLLSQINSKVGFVDVGSGGELKKEWQLLPRDKTNKFDFDPEEIRAELPLCISNQDEEAVFYIAEDPRASSLHQASESFVKRFGFHTLRAREEIRVARTTLDKVLEGRFDEVDVIDINVEGHDYQVLQGASSLLDEGFVKCIKVEFELTEVWQGQGWFSDIDSFLREKRYDLARLDVAFARPARVKAILHRGEPIWGKAFYVPNLSGWQERKSLVPPSDYEEELIKAIVLYTILDIPGRSIDLLDTVCRSVELSLIDPEEIEARIIEVFKYAGLESKVTRLLRMAVWFAQKLKRVVSPGY